MNPLTRRDFIAASAAIAISTRLSATESAAEPAVSPDLVLWYDKPAAQWVDSLPVGSGRLGAMVFGGGEDASPTKETIQFNEDTLWSGKPRDGNNQDARKYLRQVRKAVLEDHDYQAADHLCQKMQGLFAESYQPLGNLRLTFTHSGAVVDYRRELNLDTACARVLYSVGEVHFARQIICSAPDQVIAINIKASAPGQLHCAVMLESPLQRPFLVLRLIACSSPARLRRT